MPATDPTTPAKRTPEQIMEETKKTILAKSGFSLLVDKADLGMVIKPVKIQTVDFSSLSFAGNEKQNKSQVDAAQVNAENALVKLQGKIVAESEITVGSKSIENGPYIELPLPEKIKDALKVNYSNVDMSGFVVGLSLGQDVKDALSGKDVNLRKAALGGAAFTLRTVLNALGSGVAAIAQKTAGNIPNPFSTAIFEKVTPRSFQFSWTIQPKNVDESETLKEVINLLRYYSLPNPSKDRLLLAVPYEWVLSFTGTNFLYSFSRCVMTDLDIDYSPNGMNVFMKDTRAPQAVTITVGFQEIYPLDKQIIDGSENSMKPINTIPREPVFGGVDRNAIAENEAENKKKTAEEVKKLREEEAVAKAAYQAALSKFNALGGETALETARSSGRGGGSVINAKNELTAATKTYDSAKVKLQNAIVTEQAAPGG